MAKAKHKGISLILVYSILTLLSLGLASSVVAASVINRNGQDEINRLTDGYLSCASDIMQLDETSDFLTERCREYVADGSKLAAESYVVEISESKTREKALEHFQVYFANTAIYQDLVAALDLSNSLEETELYAMRLAADFYGFEGVPSRIQAIALTEEDNALSDEDKHIKAQALVFGSSYLQVKEQIDAKAESCLNGLIAFTTERKAAASEAVKSTFLFHDIAAWALLALMLASALGTYFLVFRPLSKTKDAIDKGQRIEVCGSREMRYAATAYNRVYDENERKKEILQYEVSHDILTGIPNRHEYVDSCQRYAKDELLFVIADVDRFKGINDTSGHSIGDDVLSEVARRLRETFLNHDRVFRIGGDEFVVMVFDTSEKRKQELKGILEGINTTLAVLHEHQDNFPLVSLSFGVALKKADMTFEATYRNADKALYQVKKEGGCGVEYDPNVFS